MKILTDKLANEVQAYAHDLNVLSQDADKSVSEYLSEMKKIAIGLNNVMALADEVVVTVEKAPVIQLSSKKAKK